MRLIAHLCFAFFSNLLALYATAYFIAGFSIAPPIENYLLAAAVLGALNVFIRPVIRALMTPLIWLTLGLGLIAVNMIILKLLAFILPRIITIDSLLPLFYASIIIGIVNWFIHATAEGSFKKD